MKKLPWVLAGIVALLGLAALLGAMYQGLASRADAERFPPPGARAVIDGAQMHLDCRGQGRPLLLLEAGLMSGSSSWMRVHDALARNTEVCAYDRVGLDWSDPADVGRTPTEVAARLHRLLVAARVRGPYVLLGMSAGGVFVRAYYHAYPRDIVGMVLVDSSHEQQLQRLPKSTASANDLGALALCTAVQRFGLVRALGAMEGVAAPNSLDRRFGPLPTEDAIPALVANLNRSYSCAVMQAEFESFTQSLSAAPPLYSLGSLPLLVLSQDPARPYSDAERGDPALLAQGQVERRVWNALQNELTATSRQSTRYIVTGSGHLIQLERPQVLIDQVLQFVERLRAKTTASQDVPAANTGRNSERPAS